MFRRKYGKLIYVTESISESSAATLSDLIMKKPTKVLQVDDDLSFLKVAKQCLEEQGKFQVETASSVDEAIERMKKEDFDAIVSDFKMPRKDGLEFLKELRKKGNGIPFIIFTGKGREEVAIKALNLGADGYFTKLGEPETVYGELKHGIGEAVEKKRAYMEIWRRDERLRAVMASSPDAITISDLNGSIVDCNEATLRLTGYSSKEEIVGKNSFEFIAERDRDRALENLKKTIAQGTIRNVEYTLLKNGKEEYQGELSASALKDSSGNLIGFVAIISDITGRKNSEVELTRLASFPERNPDPVLEIDLTGKTTYLNPAARKLLSQVHDSKFFDDFEEDLKAIIGEFDTHRTENSVRENVKIGDRYYQQSIHYVPGARAESAKLRIYMIDTTERKKAEEALRESEQKYRSLVELAPDGILAVNLKGIVTSVNGSFLRLVGYDSEEEVVGKHFTEMKTIRVEDIPRFAEMFTSVMKRKSLSPIEFFYVRRDGMSRWAEVHPSLLMKDGNVAGVQVIMRDVTDRKNTEIVMEESRQRFEQLFMSNPEATVSMDSGFHILDVNPRFTQLFGYSSDEVKGKSINEVLVPEDEMAEAKVLDKKTGKDIVHHETVRRRKDGALIPVLVSAAPTAVGGKLAGYIGVYKDISQLKESERELAVMNEKLRVVGGLTRHDVRNKLSAIVGNAYLAKKELAGNSKALDYLWEMEAAVNQVTRIFDFARAYEMLGVEKLVYIDVEKTVDEAISLLSELNHIKIVNDCRGLTVLADSLLRQLFYNLIDNSLKYGEKLNQIGIHYEKAERNELRLIYEDDGVGISWDAKPRIFDEGYTTGKGSGYGLYLIRKIMEVYGWTIQETGKPGKGTRFVMTIPETNSNGKENCRIA
jgi:PAS domain S-box-containing protein